MTGRYPDTTRVWDLYSYFRDVGGNFTTIPELFRNHGYITTGMGKIFHPGKYVDCIFQKQIETKHNHQQLAPFVYSANTVSTFYVGATLLQAMLADLDHQCALDAARGTTKCTHGLDPRTILLILRTGPAKYGTRSHWHLGDSLTRTRVLSRRYQDTSFTLTVAITMTSQIRIANCTYCGNSWINVDPETEAAMCVLRRSRLYIHFPLGVCVGREVILFCVGRGIILFCVGRGHSFLCC